MRRVAFLFIAAAATCGATSPAPEAGTDQAAAPAAGPARSFLPIVPIRDEIHDLSLEMDTSRWPQIGNRPTLDGRRVQLLARLASASPEGRQRARWDYARFLIDTGQALEAVGVLDAMAESEPLLSSSGAFQGVRAIALIRGGHYDDALLALANPELIETDEGCFWRALAHSKMGNHAAAIINLPCAVSSANRKSAGDRFDFALPLLESTFEMQRYDLAETLLKALPRQHPEVKYWRGRLAFHRGESDLGIKLLTQVRSSGLGILSSRAELELVKALRFAHRLSLKEAIQRLDSLRFVSRRTLFERDLLIALSAYYEEAGDLRGALATAAPLIRYSDIGRISPDHIARAQALIERAMAPNSKLSLMDQAGIYWDYRDLAPKGQDGDQVIRELADKIAQSGMQRRAADLLEHQVRDRLNDAAPVVAVKVARWRLLAAQPDQALAILDDTDQGFIAGDVRQQRQILKVYALLSLGRGSEAIAILDDNAAHIPDHLRAELYWQAKEWRRFLALNGASLRGVSFTDDLRPAIVRQAMAAAMVQDSAELARLTNAYGSYFTEPKSVLAPAFNLLTGRQAVDEGSIDKAMVDIDKAAPKNVVLGWINALSSPSKRS